MWARICYWSWYLFKKKIIIEYNDKPVKLEQMFSLAGSEFEGIFLGVDGGVEVGYSSQILTCMCHKSPAKMIQLKCFSLQGWKSKLSHSSWSISGILSPGGQRNSCHAHLLCQEVLAWHHSIPKTARFLA